MPGFTLSQSGEEGIKSEEKRHGSMTADPTAAYTLVLSSDGWTIPLSEMKTRKD